MDPIIGRRTWHTLEPIHSAIYFVPVAGERYAAVGLDDWMSGYFASRAAPMGAVGADTVIATFFNFDHDLVRRSMDGVWERVTPAQVTAARMEAVDSMLREHVLDTIDSAELERAVELLGIGAAAACERPEGRPLFAGQAGLDWPDEPHLALWHAQTLLREYRGDGHVAALTAAGLTGCEALVAHGATGDVPWKMLRATRRRSEADWDDAVESLRSRGWLDASGEFTEAGRLARRGIEDHTDLLAVRPYAAIGDAGCDELRTLARPWATLMAATLPTR